MAELRGTAGDGPNHLLTRWFGTPDLHKIDVYEEKAGGYNALRKALLEMEPAAITNEVKTSGLRGRGGAGFATGVKWSFIKRDTPEQKYVVVNADESEPGTAKDRYIMENCPHMLIEGILIAAYAVGATQAWIYIRGEYDGPYRMLTEAIAEARAKGYIGPQPFGKDFPLDIELRRGAGAYICGEETALFESIEGKRGEPRNKPPFPVEVGLFGKPTAVNNVETLVNVLQIVAEDGGAATYRTIGTEGSTGPKLFCVSGNVVRPGVYEVEIGKTFRHIIMEVAGGPPDGRKVKVFWPGGSSAPVLPESMLDTTCDAEALAAAKSMGGSGGVIVMDDTHCIIRAAHRLLRFYAHESCGKCTPCRIGGDWAVRMYERILANEGGPVELQNLRQVSDALQNGRCLCGLGDSAGWVIDSTMRHFYSEYEEHCLGHTCSVEPVPAHA